MASVDFTDFELLKYYRLSDMAKHLGIEVRVAKKYTKAYEETCGQLPRSPKTHGILWSLADLEHIKEAHKLITSGKAENIEDAISVIRKNTLEVEDEVNNPIGNNRRNFSSLLVVTFVGSMALTPFIFIFVSYFYVTFDLILTDLGTQEKLQRVSQISYPLLILVASTAVLCFTYGQIQFKDKNFRREIVGAGENFLYSFVILTLATFILLGIAFIPYDLTLSTPSDISISAVRPFIIEGFKVIPLAVLLGLLIAGLLSAARGIVSLFGTMYFTSPSQRDVPDP